MMWETRDLENNKAAVYSLVTDIDAFCQSTKSSILSKGISFHSGRSILGPKGFSHVIARVLFWSVLACSSAVFKPLADVQVNVSSASLDLRPTGKSYVIITDMTKCKLS